MMYEVKHRLGSCLSIKAFSFPLCSSPFLFEVLFSSALVCDLVWPVIWFYSTHFLSPRWDFKVLALEKSGWLTNLHESTQPLLSCPNYLLTYLLASHPLPICPQRIQQVLFGYLLYWFCYTCSCILAIICRLCRE